MPLQATSGAASYDAFGGGVPVVPVYIEEVFSDYLYTGNGSTQTITNGIDLSTKGGLVWAKSRAAGNHFLYDTTRGVNNYLMSNATDSQTTQANSLTAFNTTGFSIGDALFNDSAVNYASWTFRKQPKFFDVVTYTGNGTSSRAIAHSLTSTPGCIIVKRTDNTGAWYVYHRGVDPTLAYAYFMVLNTTAARAGAPAVWDVAPTSTNFTVQPDTTNISGSTYVAYLFAHDAGGFGLTGTDNVISCGSYTGNGSATGPVVTLGYEPQWLMIKNASSTGAWLMLDVMRGFIVGDAYTGVAGSADARLYANLPSAEDSGYNRVDPTSTGFKLTDNSSEINSNGATYIYIAIRRGPMKVPTSGTSVFAAVYEGSTTPAVQTSFPVDFGIWTRKDLTSDKKISSRLQGAKKMYTNLTSEEGSNDANLKWDYQNGYKVNVGASGDVDINWVMRRAPSFFDEVCYTGTGASSQVLTHNLTVTPQLTIFKKRSASNPWDVVSGNTSYLQLNENFAASPDTSIAATATTITAPLGAGNGLNASGATYVAYLFATCAGVSKCGTFTGNGSSQTINCGFTGGARFVLIKKSSGTGDWMVSDSARGIVSGNDPYLELNNTNAEVTGEDWLDTDSTGFVVNEVSGSNANTNGATYIFLAIA